MEPEELVARLKAAIPPESTIDIEEHVRNIATTVSKIKSQGAHVFEARQRYDEARDLLRDLKGRLP